jgi:hypothetical protein
MACLGDYKHGRGFQKVVPAFDTRAIYQNQALHGMPGDHTASIVIGMEDV